MFQLQYEFLCVNNVMYTFSYLTVACMIFIMVLLKVAFYIDV